MSDGEAPQLSEVNTGDYSNLDPSAPSNEDSYTNGNGSAQDTKNNLLSSAQSARDSVLNHPTTQGLKDTMQNGPVAESVKVESAKTSAEFRDLADARKTPNQSAATGQPLTHYHSMFYRLLSWKNPRATAISFATCVLFIFAARYVNILRYIFKILYITLGITATAEAAGKAMFGTGFASQMRPRKYFIIPKASLERFLDDAEQLINFFVIEFQRVVFAENLIVTAASFFAAFLSYWLIKWLPLWGLSLLTTSIIYLGPLIYIKNKEVIDAQLSHAGEMASQQARQIKDLAAQHSSRASETARQYAGQYSHKAQDMVAQYRGRSTSPEVTSKPAKSEDFPTAPKEEPVAEAPKEEAEPIAS